jgi:UPF0755 protein
MADEPKESGKTPSSSSGWFRRAPRSPSDALKPTAAPPPPPKSRRKRGGWLGSLSAAFTVILFIGIVAVGGIAFVESQYREQGPLAADKVLIIKRGDGIVDIAEQLRREGVINHPNVFVGMAYIRGMSVQVKAGEYLFRAKSSMGDALSTLVDGKAVLHTVTIPEGLTSEQIIARLNENEILSGSVREVPREGTLLPDTYKFSRGMSREQLLTAMAQAQRNAVAQIWARRVQDLPVKNPQEMVILASVVEKETGRADERPRVAGVFINRLQKRMRLQSDPTIVYGLVGGKGTLGRGILRSEIERATPYNTYVIEGLPPGPIGNPGRAAMEAVANPSRTRDLFFVADGTGGHAFAETLEMHNRNVMRWRQIENARKDGSASPSAPVDRLEPSPPAQDNRTDAGTRQPSAFAPREEPIETYPVNPARGGRTAPAASAARPARGVDAVEGTPKDPLLNRNFDLNSPQTVPRLRP